MENPLPFEELDDDEIKSQFNQLMCALYSINGNSSKEDVRALNKRIQSEVIVKPIFAQIIQGNNSLLSVVCINLRYELFHPTIKFLIKANPSALLWKAEYAVRSIVHLIAYHPSHCVMMPWIATNYQWVLDHEICVQSPPVFSLLYQYINRGRETTRCTSRTIQQFFEAYPHGLVQRSESGFDVVTPLHVILMGPSECEPALFKSLAEQCPSNVLETNSRGWTPLHCACKNLTYHLEDDLSEICKYLIAKFPEPVQILDNQRMLPIHILVDSCHHRVVKEVVVCLLREYSKSYNMASLINAAPSLVPFIQRIKSLLDEERELKENIAHLREVSDLFHDAVDGTKNPSPLASSTCNFFDNWATVTFIQRLEAKIEQIMTQLKDECNADE